jgi:hypothetical protein
MTVEDRLISLARKGRNESPPIVDTADGVIRTLTERPSPTAVWADRLWMWIAGVSCAAAVLVTLVALPFYGFWSDPLVEVVETISWVI